MAEGDITCTNNFKEQLLLAGIDMDTDTFKVALIGSGYSFVIDGNPSYNDTAITSNEITASNYTAGGFTLTALTVTQNDTGDYAKWDAGNAVWNSLGTTTKSVAHGLIYDNTVTTPVAKPVIARVEIATQPNGGNYTIAWNANGILQLS